MAAFEKIKDMYDDALKPRLLHNLMRDHVPDNKHPFGNPLDLSKVVYTIKTYNLLSESVQDPIDQKITNNWRSAIDAWIDRLLQLIASGLPDKCWAGICLLGVTCQECSSDRFMESYSGWFQKLLSNIQPTTTSQFVKVASCASMSDLITRLGGSLHVKKDGTAQAGKLVQQLIQPVLKLLDDDHSEVVWEGAVQLLCIIMSFFPFSINRQYDTAEEVIASKILSGKCSVNMLKKLAHCLALLPKSRGDEDSWSLMTQKILILINGHLNDVFLGFEEETKRKEITRFLIPPGKNTPPPLGGNKMSGEAPTKTRNSSERLQISSVSALMVCCSTMLTTSYPVQVTVPVRSFVSLIERVLMVDGSLQHSLLPFMTSMQQEFICSELPLLHSYTLELLTAIIEGVRSQILPHAAYLVRLLSAYLKRCALPELRIKVYSITKIFLISMGVGMVVSLAQDVVNSALIDLNPIANECCGTSSSGNTKPTEALLQTPQPSNRKRKHGASSGSLEGHKSSSLELGTPKNHTSPFSVKIAALEALEVLLTVGGALKSEGWRSDVDVLLINIAKNSLKGGWAGKKRNIYQLNEPADIWGDVQLAALRALLASFLSSSCIRPPYLAEGLDLFRRGKQEAGTKIAEFCAHAVLSLEVLVHPRALPLTDFSNATYLSDGVRRQLPQNMYSGSLQHRTPFSSDMQGVEHDTCELDRDELHDSWLAYGKEMEAPVSDLGKSMEAGESSRSLRVDQDKKLSADCSFGKETLEGNAEELAPIDLDVEMRDNGDENVQIQEYPSPKAVSVAQAQVFGTVALESGPSDEAVSKRVSGVNVVVAKGNETLGRDKGIACVTGNDSELDSFPDIVDSADSDSDLE